MVFRVTMLKFKTPFQNQILNSLSKIKTVLEFLLPYNGHKRIIFQFANTDSCECFTQKRTRHTIATYVAE